MSDNIPGVLTPTQWAVDRSNNVKPKRQPSLYEARRQDFLSKGIDGCQNQEEKDNWERNDKLVNFDRIPDDIYSSIVSTYQNYEVKGSKMKMMNYFTKHRMKLLFSSIGEF